MGVYIKGMEMPKDRPQLLWVYPNGKALPVQSDVDPWKDLQAVPVSEPHGRLIDADELYAFAGTIVTNKTDRDVALDCKVKAASMLREFIRRAPIIILASEEE